MPIVGVEGAVFDETGRVLLTQRRDLSFWCLPGGRVDPGETPMEAVVREVAEETGLCVEMERLVGVYCMPRWRGGGAVIFLFRCWRRGGALQTTRETIDVGYFLPDAPPGDLMFGHEQHITDAAADVETVFMRTSSISWPQRIDEHPVIARRLAQLNLPHEGLLTTALLQQIRERQFDDPPATQVATTNGLFRE